MKPLSLCGEESKGLVETGVVGYTPAGNEMAPAPVVRGVLPGPRGFTLIDLLVSIAVIGVLISLMLPSLGVVKETAHQVICRSNARQIGFSLAMYAEDRKDLLPSSVYVKTGSTGQENPAETVTLRLPPASPGGVSMWDGMGRLFAESYLLVGQVFYCPSHRRENRYATFEPQWMGQPGKVVGNYQYRGRGPNGSIFLTGIVPPRAALVSDSLRNQQEFNHEVGTNVLRADLSVYWYRDNGQIYNLLHAGEQTTTLQNMFDAWARLDEGDER